MSDMHKYALNVGALRIGVFLACLFLLIHLFSEPRRLPYFNPVVDALLYLAGFALIGYVIGLIAWFFGRKRGEGGD